MKQGRPACQIQTKEKANCNIASKIKYETSSRISTTHSWLNNSNSSLLSNSQCSRYTTIRITWTVSPRSTSNISKIYMRKTLLSRLDRTLNFCRDNLRAIRTRTRALQLSSNPPTTTLTPQLATLFLTKTTFRSLHNWAKCSSSNLEIRCRLDNHSSLCPKAK